MEHNRGYREKNKEKKTHKAKDTQLSTKVAKIHIREKTASLYSVLARKHFYILQKCKIMQTL